MRSLKKKWRRWIAAATVLSAVGVQMSVPAAAAEPTAAEPARPGTQAGFTTPDRELGKGWRTSSDVLVTGAGDTDGYHLYVARESDAFGWSTLATLTSSSIAVGPWTGAVCVTGSGRYAVAVFAPKKAANEPALARARGAGGRGGDRHRQGDSCGDRRRAGLLQPRRVVPATARC